MRTLQRSYTFLAPVYDGIVGGLARFRRESLQALDAASAETVLINGAGTGLDFPELPLQHRYIASDITFAMLKRSAPRIQARDIALAQADSLALPFADGVFDTVVMHLILAVVPNAETCLAESARVLKSGGRILVFDKFLRRGERAFTRRLANLAMRHFATRLDVVLEDVVAAVPGVRIEQDRPAFAAGWFRIVELRKTAEQV